MRSITDIPLNRDLFLMDEKWMVQYEKALVQMFHGADYEYVGYISHVAARAVSSSNIELSWYPNLHDRFHEVRITLPLNEFVIYVECPDYDERPHIFVKSAWLSRLHLRAYSVFALIDAVGVKSALVSGMLTRERLVKLRESIDEIAGDYPAISFISFADSLLLKSNWFVGQYDSKIQYTYDPESVLELLPRIRSAYEEILGMSIYAVLTQGMNEYYDDALLHISAAGNHICLNSIGLPFAQLMAIESAARGAIKKRVHEPFEIYMDENFYHSMRFKLEFDKNARPKNTYKVPMTSGDGCYFYSNIATILDNLRPRAT